MAGTEKWLSLIISCLSQAVASAKRHKQTNKRRRELSLRIDYVSKVQVVRRSSKQMGNQQLQSAP